MSKMKILSFALTCLCIASAGSAADWGSIKGQICLKGDVPEQALLHKKGADVKDAAVCAAHDMINPEMIVDKETHGIANVFVFLAKAPGDIHPDAAAKEDTVTFDQKNCEFIPHALFVQAGQTVEVLNSDPVAHNTNVIFIRNQPANVIVPANTAKGAGVGFSTTSRESLPVTVKCDFHPWMRAHWLVLDHPYAAVTDKEGRFEINNLPAGDHEFRIWHEKKGWLDRKYSVTVTAGETQELEPAYFTLE
ncbi:MAG: carboxypeptidase regulatory-like domain-containing protein [Planctomycetaceae bacterium]